MASDIQQVRLLISDTSSSPMFSDAEVQTFLQLEGSVVKRAAAQLLDAMASNEAMVSKVIKDRELTTDGAKVADALRKHAVTLRAQADVEDAKGTSGTPVWSFPDPADPIDTTAVGWL